MFEVINLTHINFMCWCQGCLFDIAPVFYCQEGFQAIGFFFVNFSKRLKKVFFQGVETSKYFKKVSKETKYSENFNLISECLVNRLEIFIGSQRWQLMKIFDFN